MTTELARASYEDTPPFDGDTCVIANLSLVKLWECYKSAVSILASVGTYDTLIENQDWHRHDGIITRSGLLPASEWASWLESPEAFSRAWQAEDYCHQTVYPPDLKWCLRFHVWEDIEAHKEECGMDLSGEPSLVARFASIIKEKFGVEYTISESSDWFLESGYTPNSPKELQKYFDQGWDRPLPT